MRIFNLFISHSWKYDDQYNRFTNLLKQRPYFDYKNYSVPAGNPILGNLSDPQLEQAIENQMRPCSIVIIMAGVYSTYSKWINKEITMAKRLGKPILAVKPFGAERISSVVRNAADLECAWNTESIVDAIRSLA